MSIRPVSPEALDAARSRQRNLLKIPGSLGVLEEIGCRIAAIQGIDRPVLGRGAVVVCCGDHGVVAEGVAPNDPSITRIQAMGFLQGFPAINQIAAASDADVWVVDAAVGGEPLPTRDRMIGPGVRPGAGNILVEPAMTREEALRAIDLGREAARRAVEAGATILCAGDMGIGNTTPSAALTSAWLGLDANLVTGRGAGLDDERRQRKVSVVERSVARAGLILGDLAKADPIDVLCQLGGPDFAAIAGVYLEGAARSIPLVTDGFPVTTGVLAAVRIDPAVKDYLFAGHQSVEPGHAWQLRSLDLEPVFRLGMRLGEGTGAVLSFPVLRAASHILSGMITFQDIGMETP
jgi:nicotinate-nucleotide--dimethylbenzimidazole phosphoribosyltransferase